MLNCVFCGSKTELFDENIKFPICGKKECYEKEHTLLNDNCVTEKFFNDKITFEFLLKVLLNALNSQRDVFNPKPWGIDLNKISSYYKTKNTSEIIKLIGTCENDEELYKKIGNECYYFLKYGVKNNRYKVKETDIFKQIKKLVAFEVTEITDDVKPEFAKKCYLYHGSGVGNWYSIMVNGLKNYSGTKNMAHGQAYGAGIYLSDTYSLSAGYSGYGGDQILGVFEVCGDKQEYKKSSNIFVVPDEEKVRLKYIIYVNPKDKIDLKHIDGAVNGISVEVEAKKRSINRLFEKRLLSEVKKARSYIEDPNSDFTFLIDENDLTIWRCLVKFTDKESPLYKDLKQIGRDNIEVEIRFNDTYPMTPPFVRVIEPRFKFMTGHVTSGGNVCSELLAMNGWTAATKIDSTIVSVQSTILAGNGRIDMSCYNKAYSYQEALTAYNRMLKTHGWE